MSELDNTSKLSWQGRIIASLPFWGCLSAVMILSLLFPGDISFINDESELINRALDANEAGTLVKLGLKGTAGVQYGPIPIWYYQLNLLFSNDLITLSLVKNMLGMVTLALVLTLLAKEIRLNRWCIFLCFLSPYIYYVNRALWDDCFMISLVGLLALSFVRFCRHGRLAWFVVGNIVCALLVYIQIKAVFSIIPFYLCLFGFEWRRLLVFRKYCILILAMAALTVAPYAIYVIRNINVSGGSKIDLSATVYNGLAGARFFSFTHFFQSYLPEFFQSRHSFYPMLTKSLVVFTGLIGLPFILGVYLGCRRLIVKLMNSRPLSVYDKTFVFACATIVCQFCFQLITRKVFHFQYYYGVWFSFFYLTWFALSHLWNFRIVKLWFVCHQVSMLALLISLITFVHINGGGRTFAYSSTLSNQIETVRSIRQYSPRSRVLIRVSDMSLYAHRYFLLHRMEELKKPWTDDPFQMPMFLIVDYSDPEESHTGWITVKNGEIDLGREMSKKRSPK